MGQVIDLKAYRDRKSSELDAKAHKDAIKRILARVPMWPDDPKPKGEL